MGTVQTVTNQLNNLGACNQSNCCDQIDAIKTELARVNARLSHLESQSDGSQALKLAMEALAAINPLKQEVANASTLAGDAMAGVDYLTPLVTAAGIGVISASANIGRIGASLTALGLAAAPLIAAAPAILAIVAGIGAIYLSISAAQTAADSAYDLAESAFHAANSAFDRAVTAIMRADSAISIGTNAANAAASASSMATRSLTSASTAETTAKNAQDTALGANRVAADASDQASRALAAAIAAEIESRRAFGTADNASGKADRAIGAAGAAQSTADRAVGAAGAAQSTADRAVGVAGAAQSTSDRAVGVAGAAQSTSDRAVGVAGAAQSTADSAVGAAGAAQSTADRALTAASTPGVAGKDGRDGVAGKDGRDGKDVSADPAVQTLSGRVGSLETKVQTVEAKQNAVNSGKEDEIIALLQGNRADIAAVPAALVASQSYRAAVTSAAAVGSCQSSKPGGCPGGLLDKINTSAGEILQGISALGSTLTTIGMSSLQDRVRVISATVNKIDTKLGAQITGGLSSWVSGLAEVANRSQILNIITYIGVLHNAYFLSNSLTQTLFSTISNSLAALGIKDTSADPAGTPFNVGKIIEDWTDAYFKSIFGVAEVNGIKAEWKKMSRIYQAAAQVMYSMQSIGQSILGALEVVGSHVAKIGNALQKVRVVGEKAYSWMNPTPFFQNRFFTGLQATQEVVSQIDQVASSVLSVEETITQMGKNKDDLVKSMGEGENSKQAEVVAEAAKTKKAEDQAKAASKSPEIPESSQVKP